MTDSSLKIITDLISEFLAFLWLLLAFFVSLIILLGQKIETINMPSFRSLNFGQKPKEEIPETEDVNGGFLNRRIVVEKVKNVFGKTLKPKEKSEEEDFDIKKVIKLFQNGKKSVTFAEKDEVINEIISDFETSTSFCEEEEEETAEDKVDTPIEETEVKNLLFHEVDENFKPEVNSNYTNVGFWKNGNGPSDILTIVIGQEPPKPPSEPPPLPPKLCQKFNSKTRPSIPPPLPPKAISEAKPPVVRRDLKSKTEVDSSVSELVNNFIKLQSTVLPESENESTQPKGVISFEDYKPITFLNDSHKVEYQDKIAAPTFSTFKPEATKKDWKEAFFQPMNKSLIADIETKPKVLVKRTMHSSKIPKLVEEMMEKSLEKKSEGFTSETLKKCNVKVSSLVSNFEQIQKDSKKDLKHPPSVNGFSEQKPSAGFPEGGAKVPDLNGRNGVEEYVSTQVTASSEPNHVSKADSEIFFRAGILAQLESQRDEKLADLVIQLQSRCRGYLARKKLAKLKVQDLAVRCIQRNVRKLMQVREWPWWRLYVKVTPLLNVHRTEEELTAKIQELEALKATLEKLEQERNQLKLENDKLETKSHEAKERWLKRRRRKMERNLGFFEAWRAKRKEKRYEEVSVVERLSTRKTENGVLSRFLNMGNQEVSMVSAVDASNNVPGVVEKSLVNGDKTASESQIKASTSVGREGKTEPKTVDHKQFSEETVREKLETDSAKAQHNDVKPSEHDNKSKLPEKKLTGKPEDNPVKMQSKELTLLEQNSKPQLSKEKLKEKPEVASSKEQQKVVAPTELDIKLKEKVQFDPAKAQQNDAKPSAQSSEKTLKEQPKVDFNKAQQKDVIPAVQDKLKLSEKPTEQPEDKATIKDCKLQLSEKTLKEQPEAAPAKTQQNDVKLSEQDTKPHLSEKKLKEQQEVDFAKAQRNESTSEKPSAQPKTSTTKVKPKSSDIKSPSDSRRSSYSILSESNSRRSSLALTSLNSFSNLQEKFQALAQENSQSEKKVKVGKLNEDALKVGKDLESKTKELVKSSSKVDANLQSKISKFGTASGGGGTKVTKKSTAENETEMKIGKKTDIKKATTAGVKNSSGVENEDKLLRKDLTGVEIESKESTVCEVSNEKADSFDNKTPAKTTSSTENKVIGETKSTEDSKQTATETKETKTVIKESTADNQGSKTSARQTSLKEPQTNGESKITEVKEKSAIEKMTSKQQTTAGVKIETKELNYISVIPNKGSTASEISSKKRDCLEINQGSKELSVKTSLKGFNTIGESKSFDIKPKPAGEHNSHQSPPGIKVETEESKYISVVDGKTADGPETNQSSKTPTGKTSLTRSETIEELKKTRSSAQESTADVKVETKESKQTFVVANKDSTTSVVSNKKADYPEIDQGYKTPTRKTSVRTVEELKKIGSRETTAIPKIESKASDISISNKLSSIINESSKTHVGKAGLKELKTTGDIKSADTKGKSAVEAKESKQISILTKSTEFEVSCPEINQGYKTPAGKTSVKRSETIEEVKSSDVKKIGSSSQPLTSVKTEAKESKQTSVVSNKKEDCSEINQAYKTSAGKTEIIGESKNSDVKQRTAIEKVTAGNISQQKTTEMKESTYISTVTKVEKVTQQTSVKDGDSGIKKITATPESKTSLTKPTNQSVENKVEPKKETQKILEKNNKVIESGSLMKDATLKQDTKLEEKNTTASLPKTNTISEKKIAPLKPLQDPKIKKLSPTVSKTDSSELMKEAAKVRESLTNLTNQLAEEGNSKLTEKTDSNKYSQEDDKSEISYKSQDDSASDSVSLRKDQKKLLKKLKAKKSNPDECYPKTQKLLTGKPINAFEQANFEESKAASVISPTKVEAFLRETLSPPVVSCGNKDPVKTMEAVVEEILTSKSEKSKYEKPLPKPPQVKYTSRGEVICGVVSIKPSNKAESEESPDTLSAITLVPAFRPEKSIFDAKEEKTSDYFSESSENARKKEEERLARIVEDIKDEEKGLNEEPEKFTFSRERSPFSPVSDFSDDSYDHYIASVDYSFNTSSYDLNSRRRSQRSTSTPRRIFPQVAIPSSYRGSKTKEDSPVVFDAGLSFDLSSNRTSLRRHFKPLPAFTDRKTNSNSLSVRIADFLKRTDHIMDEWKHLGKGGDDLQSLVELPSKKILGEPSSKCKSATNIMIKGLLNYSKGSRAPSMRSRSTARTSENSDRTISDIDELSEMTMDLSEERATSTTQAERLEAETAERVRLEQELSQIQHEKKNLQQTSERLEMELFYARADVNGLSESEADLEDGGGDAALYKNKCERAMRELEFTRRRLQQQHEDDLEQLVGLKKQLEKKLTDAYEEVEEQRQVAAQWKRKVQKLQSETNDLRLLLEEQSSRNNLLEKKQRKFDSEIQLLQEELRSEKNQKERSSREKEMAYAEKYSMEQNLSSVRLELELKEEKVTALSRELEELTRGGGTEQEITQLRKSKHDLEMKLKEQEEELDELAGQVSMLEGNKLRLEMSLESLRKEHRREMAQRDDELDEARSNAHKKIKVLESQLESEHEERTLLVREKHELERRLADAEERGRHYRAADEDALQRARRDLKKTKALLRDAQVMLERAKQDSPSKAALRALKNQLEDAELARASAVKARQSLESELNEVNGQLEEALRAKGDAENRCQASLRETNGLRTQVDENEEELAELLKKYRQTVQQLSAEQLANQETAGALAEAEAERASLRDQLAELTAKLEANSIVDPISGIAQKKLEIRIKELESRLELEQTTRGRLEVQITRLKENVERLNEECMQARTKEQAATDSTRKLQRSLREVKEELAVQQAKEQEAVHKRKEVEKRLETAEQEASTARTDLRLAVKRIEDLQSAISGEIGSDSERSESDEEDSGDDSIISHVPSTISSASRTSRTPDLTPR